MKLISQTAIAIYCLIFITACSNVEENKLPSANKIDSLKVGYLDVFLIGEQLFPVLKDSAELKDLLDEKVLLSFESDDYYYVFYNKRKKFDFLSNMYWQQMMPRYIDSKIEDGPLSYKRFSMVTYYDPFLTGFYNSKDSIIVLTSDLENLNRLNVNYFSTSDTLMKLNNNISVGESLENVILKLQIPNNFKQKEEFELVLMEATTQVNNAWYNDFPDYCSDFSVTVVLSIKNNKLARIQYFDSEYIDYIFKKISISTKDIHY